MAARAALTSWKQIATYLGKGVRTVQRWEQELDLPVRRSEGHGVIALPDELDAWIRTRMQPRSNGNDKALSNPNGARGTTHAKEVERLSNLVVITSRHCEQLKRRSTELFTSVAQFNRRRRTDTPVEEEKKRSPE